VFLARIAVFWLLPTEQDGAEHAIAIFTALAASDMGDHASAVDIVDLESCGLGATRARSVESHQQDAVEGVGAELIS